jgi:HTH-type transcriptional regulator/antitoxin HigA
MNSAIQPGMQQYAIHAPQTIEGILELRMYELKLKQTQLAKILGVTEAKLSRILNGKMSPDVAFLKALHEKLGIDADFLLTAA